MKITLKLTAAAVLMAAAGLAAAQTAPATAKGDALVGPNDMTLYTFDKDAVGVTNCYDKCAENWPPLIADAGAAPEGDFTLVDRTDGSKMWAYKGWPLYFWVKDEKPGDTTGDMVGEVWHTAVEQ